MTEIVQRVDRRETAPRKEHRFRVSENVARLAMRTAGHHLKIARDDRPFQWSTTTYCDTYDWSIYRRAEAGESIQLRIREYHRIRPDKILTSPRAWIELKDDQPDASRKLRFEVSAGVIPAFLRGQTDLPVDDEGLAARVRALIAAGARPVVVTQYNRLAYVGPEERIRITADHNLMYLATPWTSNVDSAVPSPIGPVLAREPDVIFEMKWVDELPSWAVELFGWLRGHAPEDRPPKFTIAMRHLLGHQDMERTGS